MKKILIPFMCIALLTGCASNISPNAYDTSAAGQINNVQEGIIINARPVSVSNENGDTGTLAGGIAGGAAGSMIGGNTAVNIIGAVGGAVLGGYLGGKAEQGLSQQTGMEYIVKLDSGKAITLTQGSDVVFHVGQPVYVLDGGSARARIIAR